MKLNNKGFAITTIIYGTLVVFLLLLSSLLGMLSTHKVRIKKLKEKTLEIIDPKELECTISAESSGETIGNNYYTGMTLTIKSNYSNVTYSLDGKNVSEMKLSSAKTGTITYSGKVEKGGKTATCSITISQRKEYYSRSCNSTKSYSLLSSSCGDGPINTSSIETITLCEMICTGLNSACIGAGLTSSCTCTSKCSCSSWGAFSWGTTAVSDYLCYTDLSQTRTTYSVK